MELKERTKRIALRVIKVIEALLSTKIADVIGRQLLRSETSVGANYSAACRGKSPADMIAKLAIVEEEADESIYWIELLIESETLPAHRLVELIDELNQIVATESSSLSLGVDGSRRLFRPGCQVSPDVGGAGHRLVYGVLADPKSPARSPPTGPQAIPYPSLSPPGPRSC